MSCASCGVPAPVGLVPGLAAPETGQVRHRHRHPILGLGLGSAKTWTECSGAPPWSLMVNDGTGLAGALLGLPGFRIMAPGEGAGPTGEHIDAASSSIAAFKQPQRWRGP